MDTVRGVHDISSLTIVFQRQEDKNVFERLLDGRIVRVRLDEGDGTRWVSHLADDSAVRRASDTSLTLNGEEEDDVEGHYHPGTYAPRFDLNTRDIEAKAALQRAMEENRVRSFELEDSTGHVVRVDLIKRAGQVIAAAGNAVMSFAVARGEAAQEAVLKLHL